MPALAALAAAVLALYLYLRKVLGASVPESLTIVRATDDSTELDRRTGAVRSIQSAEVEIADDVIGELWTPRSLERLARTYWAFLTRATLGLVRVYYTDAERYVCLLVRPLKLLTFRAPEYEMDDSRGLVRWRIERGLLVARPGREGDGYLEIDVERGPSATPGYQNVSVEVEVANFYPAIASRLGRWLYANTQSRIHVLVTQGFLRSLGRLDLEESVVGRFVGVDEVPDPSTVRPHERKSTAHATAG
ncbi:MAG: hypothetical protein ACXVFN_04060 [Solirubrobacteraceae bacterium]